MIQTSYFSKMRLMTEEEKSRCVSIAISYPKGLKIKKIWQLAPPMQVLLDYKELGDKKKYTEKYLLQLENIGIEKMVKLIPEDAILLCWERSMDFCHRHILSQWLRKNGIKCEEYK